MLLESSLLKSNGLLLPVLDASLHIFIFVGLQVVLQGHHRRHLSLEQHDLLVELMTEYRWGSRRAGGLLVSETVSYSAWTYLRIELYTQLVKNLIDGFLAFFLFGRIT